MWCSAAEPQVARRTRLWQSHFDGDEMVDTCARVMSVHVKEHQRVKISGSLQYGVSHCTMVVARKTPEITILSCQWYHCLNQYDKYNAFMLALYWGFHLLSNLSHSSCLSDTTATVMNNWLDSMCLISKYADLLISHLWFLISDAVLLIGKVLNNILDFTKLWRNQNMCLNYSMFNQKPGQSLMFFQSKGVALTINSIL